MLAELLFVLRLGWEKRKTSAIGHPSLLVLKSDGSSAGLSTARKPLLSTMTFWLENCDQQ